MDSSLRALVDLRDRQIQKARIQFSNRLSAIERGADISSEAQAKIIERWLYRFDELESELDRDIKEVVIDHVMYKQLTCVKGIGPMMAAKLLALIEIDRCSTISALWRYAGLAVINGKAERPVKGERLHYSKRMKSLLYNIAGQMLKAQSPYVDIYYEWKEHYKLNRSDWTKNHCHLAAIRKMNRIFLEHLWRRWRMVEGLPAPEAWVFSVDGHTHEHYMKPEHYGWPSV